MQKKSSCDLTRESVMVEHNLSYPFVSLRGRFKGRVPLKERGVTLHKGPEYINWGYLFCFILISWGASQVQFYFYFYFYFFAMSQFDCHPSQFMHITFQLALLQLNWLQKSDVGWMSKKHNFSIEFYIFWSILWMIRGTHNMFSTWQLILSSGNFYKRIGVLFNVSCSSFLPIAIQYEIFDQVHSLYAKGKQIYVPQYLILCKLNVWSCG
jgi:hypothetical protein